MADALQLGESHRALDAGELERLAAIEHERWAHWQKYLHQQCKRLADGSLVIPAELVVRWTRQIETAYADLSEVEKESDREQVRRYFDRGASRHE